MSQGLRSAPPWRTASPWRAIRRSQRRALIISLAFGAAKVATHPCGPAGIIIVRRRGDLTQENGARGSNEAVAAETKTAGDGAPMPTVPGHRGARRMVHIGASRPRGEPRRSSGHDPDRGRCRRDGAEPTACHLAEVLGDGQDSVGHDVAARGPDDPGNRDKSTAEAVARRRGWECSSRIRRRRKIYRRSVRVQARGREGSSARRVHSPVVINGTWTG